MALPRSSETTVIAPLSTIKNRPDFLAVRGGLKSSCAACLIEGRKRRAPTPLSKRPPVDADLIRFGLVVTKKLGSAVVRNRIRRRLKSAIALAAPERTCAGFDYVVVARSAAFDRPHADLVTDLARCFDKLHKQPPTRREPSDQPTRKA